jgi:tungstate transport system ATP-binding protein
MTQTPAALSPRESSSLPVLEGRGLTVSYGKRRILDIESIQVIPNKVLALIGPNGSGKTTLMLCLSLLLKPTTGEILYRGQTIHYGPSIILLRRHFAVAFQEPLLLNASVWDNVTLGLTLRGIKGPEIKNRAQYWLERFGVISLARQHAHTLSGGEAQRVNLARAFALQPEVLFLDEPFAAVDVPTRQSLFGDMINILQETKLTTVMVTHDRNEAQTLAQQVIVLIQGKVAQRGSPREIFSSPASEEIAKFVGMENIIEGTVTANKDCLAHIDVHGQVVEGVSKCDIGGKVNIFIRPEDITLSLEKRISSARNVFQGKIVSMIPSGPLVRVNLDCGFGLIALITKMSAEEMHLETDLIVYSSFKAAAIHVIAV